MSDFENFLCFSSAMAQRCGRGTAEAKERSHAPIIYEGNDRILLSESNLRSGFPVANPPFKK